MPLTPNVEVTGAARLYRAASVWTAGLGVAGSQKSMRAFTSASSRLAIRPNYCCSRQRIELTLQ